jgi:hypothetical protein
MFTTSIALASPGCSIVPGMAETGSRDTYPVRLVREGPDHPVAKGSAVRPPVASGETQQPLTTIIYPTDDAHSAESSGPTPVAPPDSVPPPEPPPLVVRQSPQQPAVVTALQYTLDNRPDRALDAVQNCPQANQKLIMRLLPPLADLADPKVDISQPATAQRIYELLRSAESELSLSLTIDKMCFCKNVKSFGCYDVMAPSHEFRAGNDEHGGERVRVYLELRNLSAHQNGQVFQSAIASRIAIHDSEDKEAFRQDDPNEMFQSRSPRNDIFLECQFEVPRHIPPGTYTLWIDITDKLAKPPHTARRSIEMKIGN